MSTPLCCCSHLPVCQSPALALQELPCAALCSREGAEDFGMVLNKKSWSWENFPVQSQGHSHNSEGEL